jgi:hypothetical protein
VALEVERLGPGSERTFQNATLERMHGGRRDAIGNDSESGLPVDLRDGINQLEVLRCVHGAPVTMNEAEQPLAPAAIGAPERRPGPVRQSVRDFVSVEVGPHLRGV